MTRRLTESHSGEVTRSDFPFILTCQDIRRVLPATADAPAMRNSSIAKKCAGRLLKKRAWGAGTERGGGRRRKKNHGGDKNIIKYNRKKESGNNRSLKEKRISAAGKEVKNKEGNLKKIIKELD